MAQVQFGVVVPTESLNKLRRQHYIADVSHLLNHAKGHFTSAWVVDHLQFDDSDVLEAWTTLSYLSAQYPEFQWGHTVLCQSFRNPALVAKMGATLQFLSGGRFTLGIGAGWHESEYLAYGYEFPRAGIRVKQLDEALHVIKQMWTQDLASVEGQHHRIKDAYCEPKPDPVPPIMIGAFKAKMLRLVAKHADWWNVSSTSISDYRKYLGNLERACEDIGRDPKTIRRSWCGGCACAPTPEEVKHIAGDRLDPGEDLMGTPQQLIEQIQAFVELGVDYFMLDCVDFPELTTATTLVNEVLPAFNS